MCNSSLCKVQLNMCAMYINHYNLRGDAVICYMNAWA